MHIVIKLMAVFVMMIISQVSFADDSITVVACGYTTTADNETLVLNEDLQGSGTDDCITVTKQGVTIIADPTRLPDRGVVLLNLAFP